MLSGLSFVSIVKFGLCERQVKGEASQTTAASVRLNLDIAVLRLLIIERR
jgi:hypothetical protein